jgi:Caspase domain
MQARASSALWLSFSLTLLLFVAAPSFAQGGTKRALVVGIDAYTNSPLKGCVLDATRFGATLISSYGFAERNVAPLFDKEATHQAILGQLQASAQVVQSGDLFVFYYSGHGSLYPDEKDGDEVNVITPIMPPGYPPMRAGKYDSTLVPVDVHLETRDQRYRILDDELYEAFAQFTSKGCDVVFISDSCHSGSLAKSLTADPGVMSKYLPLTVIPTSVPRSNKTVPKDFSGKLLVYGSSRDEQTSGATKNGSIFTNALLQVLHTTPQISYEDLFTQVHDRVLKQSEGEQEPQLDKRFYGGNLKAAFLSEAAAGDLQVGVLVLDSAGKPLEKVAVGIFPLGTKLSAGAVRKESALTLGTTNQKGGYQSALRLPRGRYVLKAVLPDSSYKPLEQEIEIRVSQSRPDMSLITVRLVQ